MTEQVHGLLKKYRVPFFHSAEIRAAEAKKLAAGARDYLRVPMAFKAHLMAEMLARNYSLMVTDSDTFHFRGMIEELMRLRSKGYPVDIAVSAYRADQRNMHMWKWHRPFVKGSASRFIPNNGVAAYFASDASRRFSQAILKSNQFEDGWLQVNFCDLLDQGHKPSAYFEEVEPHVFVGTNNRRNVTVAMLEAIDSELVRGCYGNQYGGAMGKCLHHHALSAGKLSFTGSMSQSAAHALARSQYMKDRGFWVLDPEWQKSGPRFRFKEFLAAVDLRRRHNVISAKASGGSNTSMCITV